MAIAPGGPQIVYYALPGDVAREKHPTIKDPIAMGFQCKRWIHAFRERAFHGSLCCNALAHHFFWHYPCEFVYDARGL